MTVPVQRTLAVLQARELLKELASSSAQSGVPEHVRREAERLLRHFPFPSHMQIAHLGAPLLFGPAEGASW
jgi:hypothetical protein